MLVVEPLLLSTWGYTPGKWIFGLQVKDTYGGKIYWTTAMARTWQVFAKGEGYGIPFYNLYRNYKSYRALSLIHICREEIAIMKMCGATNSFVRWPFVFEGLILGLFGALVAFFLEWGIYVLVGRAITTSDTINLINVLAFQPMALRVLGVFVLTGFVIGAGGSVMAIRKFLQV